MYKKIKRVKAKEGTQTNLILEEMLATELNNDKLFVLAAQSIPISGVSDDDRKFALYYTSQGNMAAAILFKRRNPNEVDVICIRGQPAEVAQELTERHKVVALRGLTTKVPEELRKCMSSIITHDEIDIRDEQDKGEEMEEKEERDTKDKKEAREKEDEEPMEAEVNEEIENAFKGGV